jgi:hypothetical protein
MAARKKEWRTIRKARRNSTVTRAEVTKAIKAVMALRGTDQHPSFKKPADIARK